TPEHRLERLRRLAMTAETLAGDTAVEAPLLGDRGLLMLGDRRKQRERFSVLMAIEQQLSERELRDRHQAILPMRVQELAELFLSLGGLAARSQLLCGA